MQTKLRLTVISMFLVCLLLLVSGISYASDYVPRPGVLSPDQVDFGGKTVTILVRDLDWVVHNGGKPLPERVAEAEALYNVKIQTMDPGTVENIMSRIMANDSTYDIIRINHRNAFFPLVTAGMLYPVSQILPKEYFESLPAPDRYSIEKLRYQGELYGVGIVYGLFNGSMMITMYNKDLIEREGLEDPYQLWKEGRWTYEAMEQIGIALTKDTDGDGEIDQWGIGALGYPFGIYRVAPSNGAEIAKPDESGRWVYTFNSPEAIYVLNTLARWQNELQIVGGGDFNLGTVGIIPQTHLAGARHALAAGVNVGYVPQPRGPHVDSHQWPTFDFSMNMIPINAEYPEGLIALIDFLFRAEDGEEYLDFYINSYMTSREHAEVYMTGAEEWKGEGDPFQNSGLWDIVDGAVNAVMRGEKGAAVAMDEIAQQAQAFLDDLFNQ